MKAHDKKNQDRSESVALESKALALRLYETIIGLNPTTDMKLAAMDALATVTALVMASLGEDIAMAYFAHFMRELGDGYLTYRSNATEEEEE